MRRAALAGDGQLGIAAGGGDDMDALGGQPLHQQLAHAACRRMHQRMVAGDQRGGALGQEFGGGAFEHHGGGGGEIDIGGRSNSSAAGRMRAVA
jgi:hypothetical protein